MANGVDGDNVCDTNLSVFWGSWLGLCLWHLMSVALQDASMMRIVTMRVHSSTTILYLIIPNIRPIQHAVVGSPELFFAVERVRVCRHLFALVPAITCVN